MISPDFDSHLLRLVKVFKRLQDAGLKLKPTKCKLLQDEFHYLGHVATDPAKVEAIKKWEPPKNVKSSQELLRIAGYYRQHLLEVATVAKPLTQLVSKYNSWV